MPSPPAFDPPLAPSAGCALCAEPGGLLLWSDSNWRVIRAEDADFPALYRVICREHVAEFSALTSDDRCRCMDIVATIDGVLVGQLRPTKVNVASLGNMVAHLHWHVVARYEWDSRFPQSIWSAPQRTVENPATRLGMPLQELDDAVVSALCALSMSSPI